MTRARAISGMVIGICATSASSAALAADSSLTKAELASVKGQVGVAVVDKSRDKHFWLNQAKGFPMQSVCKLPVSIAILKLVDQGKLKVDEVITIKRQDLVPYHSPLKEEIKGQSTDFTIRKLVSYAIRESDNTACDTLIAKAGGTSSVTRLLTQAGVKGVRVDRPEGRLQPDSAKIDEYLLDPRDTATPEGAVDMLDKLYTGKLLSKSSTAIILEDLFACNTGPNRIRAGLPKGWKLAHKTGTGADVSGKNAGTNDIGIAVGPDGQVIYLSVFIKGSEAKLEEREALIAKVDAKAVAGNL